MKRSKHSVYEKSILRSSLYWFITVLFLLSCSVGKRRGYLLPSLPALALALSVFVSMYRDVIFNPQIVLGRVITKSCSYVFCVLLGIIMTLYFFTSYFSFPPFELSERNIKVYQAFSESLFQSPLHLLGISVLILAVVPFLWRYADQKKEMWFKAHAVSLFILSVMVFFVSIGLATKGRTHSHRDIAQAVSKIVSEQETLMIIKKPTDESFDGFLFYYRDPVAFHSIEQPIHTEGWYIFQRDWLSGDKRPSPEFFVEQKLIGGSLLHHRDREWMLVHVKKSVL
jgi:hypothetical protein